MPANKPINIDLFILKAKKAGVVASATIKVPMLNNTNMVPHSSLSATTFERKPHKPPKEYT